eukprot:s1473_g6.t1
MFGGSSFVFKRTALAVEYGIHSAICVPTKTGVIEVGAMLQVAGPDDLIPPALVKVISEGGLVPEVKPAVVELPPCPPWLEKVAASCPEACYAIEWTMGSEGALKVNESYNPAWRVQYASQAGLPGLYTSSSKALTFQPGEGVVGQVFQAGKELFVKDVQQLTEQGLRDDMFSGNQVNFLRADMAKTFNIRSAAFVPLRSGVLELGSMKQLENMAALRTESGMKAIEESPCVKLRREALDALGAAVPNDAAVLLQALLNRGQVDNPSRFVIAAASAGRLKLSARPLRHLLLCVDQGMAVKLPSLDLQAETIEMKRTLQHRRSLFRTGSTALILSCDRPDGKEQFGSPGRLFSDLPDPESFRRRMEKLPSVPGTPEGMSSKRASDPDGLASWPLSSWARPGRSL